MSGVRYRESIDDGLVVRRLEPAESEIRGTVLFIHGLGESGLGFERVAAALATSGWRTAIPDLPGYGRSPRAEAPLSLERCAERLDRWLGSRDEGAEPVVVGHSMGGVIGQLLCERYPARGFVNVEGNVSFDDCGFSRRIAELPLEDFRRDGLPALLDSIYRAGVDDPPLRGYHASLCFCDPAQLHRHSVELVAVSRREELAERMAKLDLPRLYLLGSPRGTAEHSRELLAEAGVEWRGIEEAGHWPFLDQPKRFEVELSGFLEMLDEVRAG